MSRWEPWVIVATPLVAVATMALGLQIGAEPAVRAAVVYGAPPSADRAGLAWQLLTIADDRGVREAVALPQVSVVARARGREARWAGATNADGIAEAWLDLPGVAANDEVTLEVRAPGEKAPLASGIAAWPAARRHAPEGPVFARASKQEGGLRIDVAVYAGRLVPGAPASVWVRVQDRATGAPVAGATIEADPEPGLSLEGSRATSDAAGWAELHATAQIHVAALGLRATAGEPHGEWYGALPVAPGAAFVDVPVASPAGAPLSFDVRVPTVLPRIYVEVDDEAGRAMAAVLEVVSSPMGPHATASVRALPPGTYWLVTSGDPRGAESQALAALARPFVLTAPGEPRAPDRGARLATMGSPDLARFVALDGLPGKRRAEGGRHRRGLALAFGSLAIAAALETLLILRSVERARRQIAHVAAMLDDEGAAIERRFGAVSVIIGILLALLGFALLATLLTWKAG